MIYLCTSVANLFIQALRVKKEITMVQYLKKWQLFGFLAVLLLTTALMTTPVLAETPKHGGFLTVATDSTAIGLDPHLSITDATHTFTEHVYEPLLTYDYQMNIIPCLATSYEHPDPLLYVFHLRKGVKFHDGGDFTSADVKFTFDRIKDPKSGSSKGKNFKLVDRVETPDKYTVKFILKQAFPDFLRYVAFVKSLPIISKDATEKHGNMQKVAIGTGAFILKEYKHGVGATYVRNPDYWDKPLPYLDGFKLVVVKDEASRLAGMRKKIYDICWVKGVHTANMARKEAHIKLSKGAESRMGRFWINCSKPPFNNVKLRQAVASCLDRQVIINQVLLGDGVPSTIIPPVCAPFNLTPEEIANLPHYKQDYALVEKLLKEAGHPNGFEFTIKTSPHSPDYVPTAEIIQQMCAPAGIKVKIQQMDWGVFQKVRRSKDYDATYYAGAWRASPVDYYYRYMRGGMKSDETLLNDPKINSLMDLTMTEVNIDKRKKAFRDLQYQMAEKVPVIITYAMPGRFELADKKIQNYYFMANRSRVYLKQAWIK
jgi:peptide/nickel transport system substrate-binding protein